MAEGDGRSAYQGARRLAKKYLSEHSGDEAHGYLPVLEDRLHGVEIMGEINLGLHEIPLRRIIGTRTAMRSNSFAGNWMPLFADDTEFAIKWQKLYMSQLKDGIREPILVYEYLNRYYVQEGNKRVSTMNYVGAASIYGNIIRLIPQRDESSRDISIYYEFLDFDKRQFFDNLWFSYKGMFTKLVELTENYLAAHPEIKDSVGEVINHVHRSFRAAYRSVNPEVSGITSGDALMVYNQVFGYPYGVSAKELKKNIRNMTPQLLLFSGQRSTDTVEVTDIVSTGESRRLRPRGKLHVAFAFDKTPETHVWTGWHSDAIERIERRYGSVIKITKHYNIGEGVGGAYGDLRAIADQHPAILFCTCPTQSDAALRISLENPDMIVMNCDMPRPGKDLNTYFCRMYDTTFLCGILAASQSETGILGYMDTAIYGYSPVYEIDAFALGAKLINPRAKVLQYVLTGVNKFKDHDVACKLFADNGADVAFCRHSPENRLENKAFPEVYAQIYKLRMPGGAPLESLGAATLDWEPFYDKVISDAIDGRTNLLDSGHIGGNPIHFGWGISTGIMDLFTNDEIIGESSRRLVHIFRDLVREGRYNPFEGPIYDDKGVLRIEPHTVPSLMQIQNIRWFEESVSKIEE